MTVKNKRLNALMLAVASSCIGLHAAWALNGPDAISIDAGTIGTLQLSGGVDGYFYGQSGTSDKNGNSILGDKATGANLGSIEIQLQKTSGIIQFNMEIAAIGGTPSLGSAPSKAALNSVGTSPLYVGTITIAPPNSPLQFTIGEVDCLEGEESGYAWNNPNLFATSIYYTENGPSRGARVDYTAGPVTATVIYGDGWDTGVFNFLQANIAVDINSNNDLNVYYGGNLGKTGLNAISYNHTSVGDIGSYNINSQMYGAYYSYTHGNLNLIPEIQYVFAKTDHQVGIDKFTSNFGVATLMDYTFGTSPYSLGGMAEYFSSNGPGDWFIAPDAAGFGLEATPTWQYKNLYARLSVGYLHLTHAGAYGNSGTGRNVIQSGLDAGVLF